MGHGLLFWEITKWLILLFVIVAFIVEQSSRTKRNPEISFRNTFQISFVTICIRERRILKKKAMSGQVYLLLLVVACTGWHSAVVSADTV